MFRKELYTFKELIKQAPVIGAVAWRARFLFAYLRSTGPKTACHFKEMFVNTQGEVYPCCQVWGINTMKIGRIDDVDIQKKLERFNAYCGCSRARFRKLLPSDSMKVKLVIAELSLACQASCAMCCVDSPSWHGKYDNYESLAKFIDLCRPENLMVQGGEVLIQKESIKWLYGLKSRYPELKIILVTNGNVSLDMLEMLENLFSAVTISIVGFEPETYKKIMGLDINKTIAFAEELIKRNKTKTWLKYLTTPLNLHETNLFLKWAIKAAPERIVIADADTRRYINDTKDMFWSKIIERTSHDIKSELISARTDLINKRTTIAFDQLAKELFEIDENFVKSNELGSVVDITSRAAFFVDKGLNDL